MFQVCPSTVARTGVRPQPCVVSGAYRFGTGAKTQPPLPGTRKSLALNFERRWAGIGWCEREGIETRNDASASIRLPVLRPTNGLSNSRDDSRRGHRDNA